jgi:hypothetical protein
MVEPGHFVACFHLTSPATESDEVLYRLLAASYCISTAMMIQQHAEVGFGGKRGCRTFAVQTGRL